MQENTALTSYFRDTSPLTMLQADSERRLAREIAALDVEVWTRLLSFPPVVERIAQTVRDTVSAEGDELRELEEVVRLAARAKRSRTRADRDAATRAAEAAAPVVRQADIDRDARDVVLADLHELRHYRGKARRNLGFSPSSATFTRYLQRVDTAESAAKRARHRFALANLRLVVAIARRYGRTTALSFDDLIQSGNLGLLKAVDRFDPELGHRFSTYASWWIRHSIGRALAETGREIRIPIHVVETERRIARLKGRLANSYGRQPTAGELADEAGLSKERVESLEELVPSQMLSLDQPPGREDDGGSLGETFVPPEPAPSQEDAVVVRSVAARVETLLDQLKPAEADVLRRRYGLDGQEEETLQVIAESYRLSRERIRQIEASALAKLRRKLASEEPVMVAMGR